jgi:hypothetical protein
LINLTLRGLERMVVLQGKLDRLVEIDSRLGRGLLRTSDRSRERTTQPKQRHPNQIFLKSFILWIHHRKSLTSTNGRVEFMETAREKSRDLTKAVVEGKCYAMGGARP